MTVLHSLAGSVCPPSSFAGREGGQRSHKVGLQHLSQNGGVRHYDHWLNNCNSKSSPGRTYSGRRRTRRDNATLAQAKAVMDRDAQKQIGERDVSPVSTARRNALGMPKSTWSLVVKELRYHPYKPIARHQLLPEDRPRRLLF